MNVHFEEAYNLNLSVEDRLKHVDSANWLVDNQEESDSLKLKNVFKVANRYFTLLAYDKYFEVSKKALQLSRKRKDTLRIAKAEYYLGDYYFYKFKNDSAYYYYLNAEKKYKNLDDKYNYAVTTLHLSRVLLFEKDFLGSEIQTINALRMANALNEEALVYECYDNLGRALSGQKAFEKSLEYYKKSLLQINRLQENISAPLFKAQSLNNIGSVYLNLNEYKLANNQFDSNSKKYYPQLCW